MSKTILITGVTQNSIGLSTLKYMLSRPTSSTRYTLFLLQRDPTTDASKSALSTLQTISPSTKYHTLQCDLSSPRSIRDAVISVRKLTHELDVALLNAGAVFDVERQLSVENDNEVDESIQVNHLGHFLLLSLMKELIKERVVFVGSSLHRNTSTDFLKYLSTSPSTTSDPSSPWKPMQAYARSKLLTALCLQRWQELFDTQAQQAEVKPVEVCIVSPGFVPESGLGRRRGGMLGQFFMKWVMYYAPFARSIQQAGESVGSVTLNQDGRTMKNVYLGSNGAGERLAECCYDDEARKTAWNWTCKVTGVEEEISS